MIRDRIHVDGAAYMYARPSERLAGAAPRARARVYVRPRT